MTRRVDVSDHAIVRYLEREKGMDMGAVRDEILSPLARDAILAGATGVTVGRTTLMVLHSPDGSKVVTTALDRQWARRKLKAGRAK